ncbi:ribonuclease H-like domain-containing protein [Tanacetum coccineum]
MHDEFEMSMIGELNFFLGLQIKQIEDEIFFNQSKYIKDMLKKFGLEDSKPTKTPMSTEINLTKDNEADSVDNSKYQVMKNQTMTACIENCAAPKQQQQVIPQTTAISNIKLPILKKEEYDIWAMEMEHYLEYIDNEVWKIQVVEKERKTKNILLMAIPKQHMRRFHGMDDNPKIDTLSIDDLYNNLRVFEQEIQGASKTSSSAQNVAFVSQSKSSTNKVKSGFTGAYSTCTPSTSCQTIISEKEVSLVLCDEVDIEEMDINRQITMIAIRMKKFYKKTGRRVRVDGKTPVGFHKKKLECFNCHNTGHFAREL